MRRRSTHGRHQVRPWAGRLGAAAVVAGLLAAGLATATFALGSTGSGLQPSNGPHPPTTTDQSPSTPPAPKDPLAPPPAPASAVTPAMKTEAQTNVHELVPAFAYLCGVNLQYLPDSGLTKLYCLMMMEAVVSEYQVFQDPPDPNYAQVALPSPALVRSVAVTCPKRLSARDCAGLKTAVLRYVNALATTAAAASGAAITVNRYSGADEDGADAQELVQAVAEKAYAGELASALAAQQKAGGALAFLLRRTHIDTVLKAGVLHAAAAKLAAPKGVAKAFVDRLVAEGLASDATDLSQTLKTVLQGVPNVPLSSALGAGLPGASLTALYRSLTAPEVAVLVQGLAGQGAASGAASDKLIGDLRQAVAAAPAARAPLYGQFVKDAGSQVKGPAATLLTVAGAALTG